MKIRLQLGLIVILLAFLGTFLEQSIAPNQQIVIQFLDKEISKEEINSAIETVKYQLRNIGVTRISIDHNTDGQLKITYFSPSDVNKIKDLFKEVQHFEFTYNPDSDNSDTFPKGIKIKDYELNISEIQNSGQINWDFERPEIVKLNQKSDSSCNSIAKASIYYLLQTNQRHITLVTPQIRAAITIGIDNRSHKIPEGRAGPIC